jgi:hypothetical protein
VAHHGDAALRVNKRCCRRLSKTYNSICRSSASRRNPSDERSIHAAAVCRCRATSCGPCGAEVRDAHRVAQAMALLWTYRPRTAIYSILGLLGAKRAAAN